MKRAGPIALVALGVLTAPSPPPGQGFLDQGVFLIARDGIAAGREEFAIRRTPGKQGQGGMLAVATARFRDRELRAALELTADYIPVSYQVDVTSGGRLVERLNGQFGRGRFAVRIVTPTGEVAREFPVPRGTAVLDDDTYDQFYFLPRPDDGAPRRVTVLRPRRTRIDSGEVRAMGPDTVMVAGHAVLAARYSLRLSRGESWEFWFSASGDLLKVAVPGTSVTATRSSVVTP
jgi:hypothetical protein